MNINKAIIYVFLALALTACSTKNISYSWERTKSAAYTAATDPMTWAPAVSGIALDLSGYDDDITEDIINMKDPIFTENDADNMRSITTAITYATAAFVPDENATLKMKRILVETLAMETGRTTVTVLNNQIEKESPNGMYEEAMGSNHAVTPFISSALTRRNLDQMNIPNWGKYCVNTVSYLAATGSAFQRVEAGLHSVSDQLYSVAIGNFLALFIHDAFMASDTQLGIDFSSEDAKMTISFNF